VQPLNRFLVDYWYNQSSEEASFLYIDGHVRIYYGDEANLPAKYISRQKLRLNATTEYWVNDSAGLPVMMVKGELTERLQQAIEQYIIPQLQQTVLLPSATSCTDTDEPVCTFIFDREAYEPAFFERLWVQYKIAVITYRKNVQDKWDQIEFKATEVHVLEQKVTMYLCEKGNNPGRCSVKRDQKAY
jgi:hypothetical protein